MKRVLRYAKSVTNMDYWAFMSPISLVSDKDYPILHKLEKIEVDSENPVFTSIDGVLYTKDMTELICFPDASSIVEFKLTL